MDDTSTVAGDVAPGDAAAWEAAVATALRGKPFDTLRTQIEDGLVLEPLYTEATAPTADDPAGVPGAAPFTRGASASPAAWDVRVEQVDPDLARANAAILADLARGATSAQIRFDAEARLGRSSWVRGDVAVDGVAIRTVDQLDRLLDGVMVDLAPVALDAGHAGLAAGAALLAVAERRGVAAAKVLGSLRVDPIAARAASGWSPGDVAETLGLAAEMAAELAASHPKVRVLGLDTATYVGAGATPAQELAVLLASAAELLRAAERVEVAPEVILGSLEATVAVDADVFGSIAKLRAARRCWSRLAEACGVAEPGRALHLHARTADRVLTRTDPWVNLLRGTAGCFAAAVAAADVVTVAPYDQAVGVAEAFGRRLARNTQIVLAEEAHLTRVVDPAGGSWYVEHRTERLAEVAWERFRALEAAGGILAALDDGSLAAALAEAHEARSRRIATRRAPLTGVSEFPLLDEDPVPTAPVDPADVAASLELAAADAVAATGWRDVLDAGAAIGPIVRGEPSDGEPLPVHRLSGPFDELRAAAEAHRQATGHRPRVFLANLGALAEHATRTGFVTNLLAAGGVEAVGPEAPGDIAAIVEAFTATATDVACVCSSDDRYAAEGAEVVSALTDAGASTVLVAGTAEIAGADGRLALGDDAVAALTSLHRTLGVSS